MGTDRTRKRRAEHQVAQSFRLNSITVTGYKSLDNVHIEFRPPRFPEDPDVFVLGSKNGVGKTSLLECCALSIVGSTRPKLLRAQRRMYQEAPRSYPPLLIRSGHESAEIQSSITHGAEKRRGRVAISNDGISPESSESGIYEDSPITDSAELLDALFGINGEPLLVPPVLLFNSYRKIAEGSSALGAMVDPDYYRRQVPRRLSAPLSTFKVILVQALMARSGLFEGLETSSGSDGVLSTLNSLIQDFAGGKVDKLRPGPDGTLELRVVPIDGKSDSFSFDGLSSGQKEIISTLFLIWYSTRSTPSVVLIDEPELHLNAEWQRVFVQTLTVLAPKNQYILATHSEEIFGSVPEENRLMLNRG